MKKSRIAKLALMGASITALAATLTTSTYAWYVSNKTATVATANGQTAASAADGSILLSWTGANDTWFKELTWSDAGAPTTFSTSTNKLSPVYFNATDGKFYGLTDGDDADTDPDEVSSGFYTFSMYIKADKDSTSVTPTVSMENTTSVQNMNAAKQIAYVATGGISKGTSFVVDAFDAMYYSLSINDATPTVVAAPAAGKFNAVHAQDNPAVTVSTVTPGAAHTYYTAVTGEQLPSGYSTAPTTGSISSLTVGTTAVKLTWTIWLAGNDLDCYNSCAAQDFSFALSFQA